MAALFWRVLAFIRSLYSRRAISVYKGTIAYLTGFILIVVRGFDRLSAMPATFTSIILMILLSSPGKSMGACHVDVGLTMLGLGLGSVGFAILGHLVVSQVAQGFVFAALVYIFALVKASGKKWFPVALVAILTSFHGIYSSLLIHKFNKIYLVDYLESYFWGAAIVLTVNTLILPISSEKELRQTLILSLEHIATFSHLLCKAYSLELTPEEREVKDHLAQGIRADFRLITEKIGSTFIEINYSRFSTKDYQRFVLQIRKMQQALIMAQSSLADVEDKDITLFKSHFLPNTLQSFNFLRASLYSTMQEIYAELGCGPLRMPAGASGYAEYMDVERQDTNMSMLRRQLSRITTDTGTADERLQSVSRRLEQEASAAGVKAVEESGDLASSIADGRSISDSGATSIHPTGAPERSHVEDGKKETRVSPRHESQLEEMRRKESPGESSDISSRGKGYSSQTLRPIFDRFAQDQHNIIMQCLIEGKLHGEDDTLRLLEVRPSMQSVYQYRYAPSTAHYTTPLRFRRRRRSWMDYEPLSGYVTPTEPPSTKPIEVAAFYEKVGKRNEDEERTNEIVMASHYSLSRVYSFMTALESVDKPISDSVRTSPQRYQEGSQALSTISLFSGLRYVLPVSDLALVGWKLVVHKQMRLAEAMSLLEHRAYRKSSPTAIQRISAVERWFRGPISIYAAKTAAAATVFLIFLLHPHTRPWFLSFNMISGALTIVTALTPTLGQSIPTFMFQVLGSGFGYTWALICLEIFHNVGGYRFNPYGVVALLAPFSLVLQYVLYCQPQFFVISFLAQNAAGTVFVPEWINQVFMGNTHFDSPGLRTGKAFSTLGIALGLVGTFQLLVLRNPSRRALRKRIGNLLYSEMSYLTLLQAYVRGVLPPDPARRADETAIMRVREELRGRETKIQTEIIDLRPLVSFAAAEARFVSTFPEDTINQILRTSQTLLDRMREARISISYEPLPDVVLKNYVQVLAPYRRRDMQVLQLGLYLAASAILAKSPLLRETPAELESATHLANFMHDMLLLASRHMRTPEGADTVRSGSFMRYFHYLASMMSLHAHVKTLEDCVKDLFGELEDLLQ